MVMAKKKRANNRPLCKHPNGQWCKKINGKSHYFGTDETAAIEKYRLNLERLRAGLPQRSKDGSPTLAELANVYIDRCRKQVSAGDPRCDYIELKTAAELLMPVPIIELEDPRMPFEVIE